MQPRLTLDENSGLRLVAAEGERDLPATAHRLDRFRAGANPQRTLPQWAYRAPLGFDLKH